MLMPHQIIKDLASGRPAGRPNGAEPTGGDGRRSDIRRTAVDILKEAERKRAAAFIGDTEAAVKRAGYLKRWTTDSRFPPIVQRLNAAALAPDITGDEFKKLYVVSRFGGGKAEGIEVDNETLATLMHTDTRGWRKTKASLEAKGWLWEVPTYRAGKQWVNAYSIGNPILRLLQNVDLSLPHVR
ncbi:MAG: hypothetical protein WBX25_34755, partial [Rhodomicrobium sp.]